MTEPKAPVAAHTLAAGRMAAECLCFRTRRLSRVVTRMYDEALRPLGIHATQLTLMNAIALGAGTMKGLEAILAIDVTTLSRSLRPLEKAGLVAIGRSPADRRVRVATLTRAGERKLEEALPFWSTAHESIMDVLGSAAAAELRKRLDDASATAQAAGPAERW